MKEIEIVEVNDEKLIEAIERLAREIWQEYYPKIISKAQIKYMLNKFQSKEAILRQIKEENFSYYLLKNNEKWIGYFSVVPKEKELFLSKFYIEAKNRGKGFARLMMQFIEKLAKENGFSKISLTVNKNNRQSIKIYERLGFVITESLVTEIGEGFVMDDYKMEKELVN